MPRPHLPRLPRRRHPREPFTHPRPGEHPPHRHQPLIALTPQPALRIARAIARPLLPVRETAGHHRRQALHPATHPQQPHQHLPQPLPRQPRRIHVPAPLPHRRVQTLVQPRHQPRQPLIPGRRRPTSKRNRRRRRRRKSRRDSRRDRRSSRRSRRHRRRGSRRRRARRRRARRRGARRGRVVGLVGHHLVTSSGVDTHARRGRIPHERTRSTTQPASPRTHGGRSLCQLNRPPPTLGGSVTLCLPGLNPHISHSQHCMLVLAVTPGGFTTSTSNMCSILGERGRPCQPQTLRIFSSSDRQEGRAARPLAPPQHFSPPMATPTAVRHLIRSRTTTPCPRQTDRLRWSPSALACPTRMPSAPAMGPSAGRTVGALRAVLSSLPTLVRINSGRSDLRALPWPPPPEQRKKSEHA